MEESSSKNIILKKYFLRMPVILITCILGFFAVNKIASGDLYLSTFFYISYLVFYLGVYGLLIYMDKKRFIIPSIFIFTIVLILISRDLLLVFNLIAALIFAFVALFLTIDKYIRFGLPIFVLLNIIFWLTVSTDNKVLVLCLIVSVIYSIGCVIKRDMEYGTVIVLAFAFILIMPVRDEPIKWTPIKNFVNYCIYNAEDKIYDIGYHISGIIDLGNSYSGYSDIGKLSGGMKDSKKPEISFSMRNKERTIYLKGATYNTLEADGLTGKESFDSSYDEWLVEYFNALYNSEIDEATAECFSEIITSEVKYKYLRTQDIIRPTHLLKIDEELKNGLDRRVGKGFYYKVQYMFIDYGSPYYKELIEKSEIKEGGYSEKDIQSYDKIRRYVKDIYNINLAIIISEDRYNDIRDKLISGEYTDDMSKYLDTSMSTDRIKELTYEITKDADSNYQKAKAIETYLRTYKYDKSVDLRDKENYIDSFIFDTKSGYCVHFASAMVLMLRDAGIPARYVSGYMHKTESKNVMGSEAHAWVEVYIEGLGWMTFEPTAGNPTSEDLTWGRKPKKQKTEEELEAENEDYIDPLEEYLNNLDYSQIDDISKDTQKDDKKVDVNILKTVLIYSGVILGVAIIVILIIIISRVIWFRTLTPEKKLTEIIRRTCKNIEKNIDDEEALRKLRANDGSLYNYLDYIEAEDKEKYKELFDHYYKYRFKGTSISEEDITKYNTFK